MTETPQQERADEDRVHTENLRDYRTLRRSASDRKVAGVAGGLGRHLNVDPTILRVIFVVLCFFGGAGFLLYGVAWLLVPKDGESEAAVSTSPGTRNALLIVAAVFAALLLVGDSWGGLGFPWPLAILALVVFVVLINRDRPMSTAPAGADVAATDSGSLPATDPAGQSRAPKPDRGPKLFWVTLALVTLALGVLGMYDVSGGSVATAAYPALGLAVVGAMLVLGAWVGRPGGLIFLGIVGAVALAVTSLAAAPFDAERRIDATPTSATQVEDQYEVSAGRIALDLTDVDDLDALDGRSIDLEANAGEIVVTVPDDVNVDVVADVEIAGEADVLGRVENGADVQVRQSAFADAGAPDLYLQASLLVGSIEVRRTG